jgi:DNA-binding Xre family transcriptional regulator
MAISYNRLWKLLIDRKMKKKDLVEAAGVSWSTIVKMGHDEHVSTEILVKICTALECEVHEVMEVVPKNTQSSCCGEK